ncbi:MAG: hypothetical protein IJ688_08555 [Treponema sp.]|nr:hypothetical protein [Treponema sp.]
MSGDYGCRSGREGDVDGRYADIIGVDWPRRRALMRRERMSMARRAKIFLPFAALTGHGEAISRLKD